MAKDYGKTFTRLFITSAWRMSSGLVKDAVREMTANGWDEERNPQTGYLCLVQFDADMTMVRRAAKENPTLVFYGFTSSCMTEEILVHIGLGGTWLQKACLPADARGLRLGAMCLDYVNTMPLQVPRKPPGRSSRKSRSRRQSTQRRSAQRRSGSGGEQTVALTARTFEATKRAAITNRVVFHGLPDEVERCRMIALELLMPTVQANSRYASNGSENYTAGTLDFTTDGKPAFSVFNRVLAQVPAVSVSLEYDDAKAGQRRILRAVDGRIVEHKVV